ncbi:hypothetical protein CKO23_25140, partial [Thiocystis violacea]|nr:hypothetical protein [Thiocystis violacea]
MVERLSEIVHPATLAQVSYFRLLGLRARVLTLPVMMGLVLGLLWRHIGSVSELVRVVQRERLLWVEPLRELTQQALEQRLRRLPAQLFERVLNTLLPVVHARWQARQRPLPTVVAWAQARYTAVLIADGSTLDGLLRKVGLLRGGDVAPLAGRMMALLDLTTRLPRRVWYDADPAGLPTAHAAALYAQRWRVEDAFAIAKRLLRLAYFYGGAQNAVALQLWSTWILYAVLVDLTDAVAEALQRPFAELSM